MQTLDNEIKLNQIRQGVIVDAEGEAWFAGLEAAEQKSVLYQLNYICMQAGPTPADVLPAIEHAGLKPTFTPCVMLQHGKLREASSRALQLPSAEYLKLFRLLMALFKIADQRRRELCGTHCRHWWHQDLSNEEILLSIREQH
ncbi:hypothetical protein Enr10x_17510 [Gimesia panareensis]|uniref:Uncharacterized protein n=1 Tax=Gimesia panareensis TaxID=2527978 RepID=A0A517Q4A4_9PLAN|nr:DUF5958 family protein [Gimesia panareensis]QDT26447.1 hypothetical protein Enr10x_17510 [Gimesia panareensis]